MDNNRLSSSFPESDPAAISRETDSSPPNSSTPSSLTSSSSSLAASSSSSASPARHHFTLRSVFVGPDGLYAFPRWLAYLAMVWIVFQLEGWLLTSLHSNFNSTWWRLIMEARMMLAAILPAFAMTRIEGRPFGDFGLPPQRIFRRNFWIGSLWGIAGISALMFALHVAGAFEFGSLALHGTRIMKFAAYHGALFLLTALFEEFLLRGYSQWVLSRGINFWPAAVFLSVAFGYIHKSNPGEAKTGLIAAGLIGFFLCLTLRRTGNLWWAVGFHMAWDWGETFLYSVPDSGALLPGHLLNSTLHGPLWLSGGSVGPEGSYLVFGIIAGLWLAFDRIYKSRCASSCGADTPVRSL
jgi:hypothetical protein